MKVYLVRSTRICSGIWDLYGAFSSPKNALKTMQARGHTEYRRWERSPYHHHTGQPIRYRLYAFSPDSLTEYGCWEMELDA